MQTSRLEKLMGIEVFATNSQGIGGAIKRDAEDFIVEEILVDGSKANAKNPSETEKESPLGAKSAHTSYLLCVLAKRNWDTFIAIKNIASSLGVAPSKIQIAGIKDAKALTAQFITIEDISPDDVSKICLKDVKIHPLGYVRNKLSSYYLLSNNFTITINGIRHAKSMVQRQIEETVAEFKAIGGVPNFFGHQRFGTIRPITHLVGKYLVKGEFRKAVMLFLAKPSRNEHPESRKARQKLGSTQNFEKALEEFPKQLHYERVMLRHLAQKQNDFIGAFQKLPVKLQLLFLQAYQSYLFNRFLSARIKNGLPLNDVEIGDHVVRIERSGLPSPTLQTQVSSETLSDIRRRVQEGKMKLALPLIGFRQKTSKGFQGEIEQQILDDEGICPENFRIKKIPEISSKGRLRLATVPLGNFSLKKILNDSADPRKKRAEISFALPRGAYATIVLREIMKTRNPVKAGF
ncbi:tRNA pseudouridine(13) synthase TruD [Candidatus Bathyarchaeota archaeon]|nr:tRNA pseudouridine(13) synthase TruD [Candidatus Bathyarchaeota archaeon]